jgi:hypothetical protein
VAGAAGFPGGGSSDARAGDNAHNASKAHRSARVRSMTSFLRADVERAAEPTARLIGRRRGAHVFIASARGIVNGEAE